LCWLVMKCERMYRLKSDLGRNIPPTSETSEVPMREMEMNT